MEQYIYNHKQFCGFVCVVLALSSFGCVAGERAEPSQHEAALAVDEAQPAERKATGVRLLGVSASGSGCPSGRVSAVQSPDGRLIYLDFETLPLETMPATLTTAVSSFCNVRVQVEVPEGTAYAVTGWQLGGWARLDQGVMGTHRIATAFTGSTSGAELEPAPTNTGSFDGPLDQAYLIEHRISTDSLQFSECGTKRDLELRTVRTLQNPLPRKNGMLAANHRAALGDSTAVLSLVTQPCAADDD